MFEEYQKEWWRKGYLEGKQEARQEAKQEWIRGCIERMLQDGADHELISKYTGLSEKQICKLAKQIGSFQSAPD